MNGLVLTILVLGGVMAATIVIALLLLRGFGYKAEGRADDLRDEVERLGEGGSSRSRARPTAGRATPTGASRATVWPG